MAGATVAKAFDQVAPRASTGSCPAAAWKSFTSGAKVQRQNASGQRIDSGQGMSLALLGCSTGSTPCMK